MKEIFINENNLTSAYHSAIYALWEEGEISDCPDYNQKQKECSMTVVIGNPTLEPRISKLIIGGAFELQQYELEVLDGILDFKIGQGTAWEYTYHQRYAYQIPFIMSELKRNPDTRRAVINIRDFKVDGSNSHPACLQSIQYFIRNNKLDCCVLFRSNDLPEATFFNMWALIKLQEKIAKELNVGMGTYTHRANSMHCYEKDFKLLDGYIKGIKERSEDLTYEYEGFYKDLMEEAIPQIMKNVEELKTH
jgi:thymidylate synthase